MMERWALASPGFFDSMDLAKNLAQWRDQSPEHWIALANRYLPPIAVAILVLLLAFKAADLTWTLLDSRVDQDFVPLAVAPQNRQRGPATGGYPGLSAWAPFGTPPEESAEAVPAADLIDVPLTDLNLNLHGVVVAQELPERGSMVIIQESGRAILSSGRGNQQLYQVGEELEEVPNTTLHSVFRDRVLLDRGGGRLESLFYPEQSNAAQGNSRLVARTPAPRNTPSPNLNTAVSVAEAVGQTAAVLSEHMQIVMHQENGEMIGFRVQPRGDGQVFSQLGLEPGDVLIEVNGMRLNNVGNTTQVIQALGESSQASITIRRNGADLAQILNIGDIQRLAESLQ